MSEVKRHGLFDLLQLTMLGDERFVYASDYDALLADRDRLAAELSAARAALLLARETLPSLDALPVTRTRVREVVEAVDAAIGAAPSADAPPADVFDAMNLPAAKFPTTGEK